MGYYQDLFNKILTVEGQGFNPYTESYSNRIGRLDAQTNASNGLVPPNGESASNGSILSENVTKEPTLSDIYTQAGYDDPLANIMNENGELNLQAISTGYNVALRDKELGVDASRVIDEINKLKGKDIESYYGEGNKLVVNPDNTLSVSKPEVTPEQDKKYTFEKNYGKDNKPIYYRWEGEPGSKKYVTYKTEEEYDKARIAYERGYGAEEIKDYKKNIIKNTK